VSRSASVTARSAMPQTMVNAYPAAGAVRILPLSTRLSCRKIVYLLGEGRDFGVDSRSCGYGHAAGGSYGMQRQLAVQGLDARCWRSSGSLVITTPHRLRRRCPRDRRAFRLPCRGPRY